jgi:cytochrome c oxidase subunit 1
VSTIGSFVMAAAVLVFVWNVWVSWRRPLPAPDDPWGGYTLEWATTSPPPPHNFDALPPIRSERPVFDARRPELHAP